MAQAAGEIFNEPLLTREKNVMVPTERALQLARSAQAASSALDNLLVSDDRFDPATTEQSFTVGMPDYLAPPFFAESCANSDARRPVRGYRPCR